MTYKKAEIQKPISFDMVKCIAESLYNSYNIQYDVQPLFTSSLSDGGFNTISPNDLLFDSQEERKNVTYVGYIYSTFSLGLGFQPGYESLTTIWKGLKLLQHKGYEANTPDIIISDLVVFHNVTEFQCSNPEFFRFEGYVIKRIN